MNINTEIQQAYANLPFKEPNEKFKDVLYKEYILKSVDWIEKASSNAAFAQNYGSNWEAAYVLEYLLDVRKIVLQRNETIYVEKCETMCHAIADFLLHSSTDISIKERESLNRSSGKWDEKNERTNWDGNTWDTSVVCNALLYYVDEIVGGEKSEAIDKSLRRRMWTILPNAIIWLYDQFDNNRTQYSLYSFGSVDYSRILIFFIYMIKSKYQQKILNKAKLKKKAIIKVIHDLVGYIDKEKLSKELPIYNELNMTFNHETVINWGDCFITSEICDAVSYYLNFLSKNRLLKNHDAWIENVYLTLKKAMRSIEITQSSEGMWGAHDDTIRCLSSYLSTISGLKIFEQTYLSKNSVVNSTVPEWVRESDCEEHKVFKAIRWLFDPKQRFNDGSYLHTSYLSVFMFEAYIAIYNHWDFANNKTLYKIYDEVFWMSPARTTQEKGQVIELEIEQEKILTKLEKLNNKIRVMSVSCAVTAMIAALFLIGHLLGLLKISIVFDKEDAEALSLILTLIVLVVTTIGARYFNKGDE